MRKWWGYISRLGLEGRSDDLYSRAIIMANRLNFILAMIMISLFGIATYVMFAKEQAFTFYTSRLILLFGINVLNLILSRYGLIKIMQLSTSLSPITILIFVPVMLGYVQDSSFFYYHLVVLGMSVIPQLVFVPKVDNLHYWFSMSLFMLLIFFLDDLMIDFTKSSEATVGIIGYFRIYYKIIPVAIFVFLHLALFYLRSVNVSFEDELIAVNSKLNLLNERLEILVEERTIDLEIKNSKLAEYAFTNAHELRAPVANMLGLLNHLDRVQSKKETKQCLALMKRTGVQLDEITHEIRDRLVEEGYNIKS
ncbi:MAG: hypothetical protein ABJG78_10130 [Cyclobacteriaceae bacterium]